MTVSIIAAVSDNLCIGKANKLLCHIPGDLKRFKELTINHVVIMGRHTFESLPNGPLPNRKNIIITSMPEDIIEGCLPADSIEDALNMVEHEDEVFVIGGGTIYKQFIKVADKMYITWIHENFDGDTFFPEINFNEWDVESSEEYPSDDKCPFAYSYVNYVRKMSSPKIRIQD